MASSLSEDDEEYNPLVSSSLSSSKTKQRMSSPLDWHGKRPKRGFFFFNFGWKTSVAVTCAAIMLVCFFQSLLHGAGVSVPQNGHVIVVKQQNDESQSNNRSSKPPKAVGGGGDDTNAKNYTTDSAWWNSKIQSTVSQFVQAKREMVQELKQDYGAYFEPMFTITEGDKMGELLGRNIVKYPNDDASSSGSQMLPSSWDRMKRKLVIKLLRLYLDQRQQQTSFSGPSASSSSKFVWATGGHSASAGHGNFQRETYTAVMERTAQKVFHASGLTLEGRNYAAGGSGSAPETALCVASLFGTDEVDVLSWDFGMTDGKAAAFKIQMYYWKAATTMSAQNQIPPVCMGIYASKHFKSFEDLHSLGLATGIMDEKFIKDKVIENVPDTMGMTSEEIEALPAAVQSLRCGSEIEKGEPFCNEEKFNKTYCSPRPYTTSWHPGWKTHKIQGILMALYLTELMQDALEDIKMLFANNNSTQGTSAKGILTNLLRDEHADYQKFVTDTTKRGKYPRFLNHSQVGRNALQFVGPHDVPFELLYGTPSVCHSGRLPSQMRYKGILTGTKATRTAECNEAVEKMEFDDNETATMRLVCMHEDRKSHEQCPEDENDAILINLDFRDSFYVRQDEGWKSLTLPNDAEVQEYLAPTQTKLKGVIAFCYSEVCGWNCPRDMLQIQDLRAGDGEITVNNVPVSNVTGILPDDKKHNCYVLQNGQDGSHYFPPNGQGKFVIAARSNVENKAMYFTSIILW